MIKDDNYTFIPLLKSKQDVSTYLAVYTFGDALSRKIKTYTAIPKDKSLPPRIAIHIEEEDKIIWFGKYVWLLVPERDPVIETDMLRAMRTEIVLTLHPDLDEYKLTELIEDMTGKASEYLANMTEEQFGKIINNEV